MLKCVYCTSNIILFSLHSVNVILNENFSKAKQLLTLFLRCELSSIFSMLFRYSFCNSFLLRSLVSYLPLHIRTEIFFCLEFIYSYFLFRFLNIHFVLWRSYPDLDILPTIFQIDFVCILYRDK